MLVMEAFLLSATGGATATGSGSAGLALVISDGLWALRTVEKVGRWDERVLETEDVLSFFDGIGV